MALRTETRYTEGRCDCCGASVLDHDTWSDHTLAHYGVLENHFGFGSDRDNVGRTRQWILCGACYDKALAALGITE